VHVWTVALVLIALAVVLRKPLVAAALLPLSMVSAGLAGLMVAAMTPGGPVNWVVNAVQAKPREWVALPAWPAVAVPAGKAVPPGGWRFVRMPPGRWAEWAYLGKQQAKMTGLGQYLPAKPSAPSYAGPVINIGVAKAAPGWWQGRLLVLVALLLLTLGLWLAPRMLRGLRPRMAAWMPELRRWLATNRWALLLPAVVAIGMAAFGVRPWTIAAGIAALIIVIRWPVIAADLVPFALGVLVRLRVPIAANWQDAPGMYPARHVLRHGLGRRAEVGHRRRGGGECVPGLSAPGWFPGPSARTCARCSTGCPIPTSRAGCNGSPRPVGTPRTPPPPNCGGSSGTCTTGPRPGWSPWA
jgi:hypothetical protein